MCHYPDCKKRSLFGFEGEKTTLYCFEHKLDGMVNVIITSKTKKYHSVVKHIKTSFPDLSWISYKMTDSPKSQIILILDLGPQILVIEIDEKYHNINCNRVYDNKHIIEISQEFGYRPIVFIRFNPHNYSDEGTNFTSCWGEKWINQLDWLSKQINYWIENRTDNLIEEVQLFYDI